MAEFDASPEPGVSIRGALSRLEGDPVARIGHNQGPPLDAGQRWRAHCWKRSRAATLKAMPIEIVRRRVARAKALGLAYPAYASILLGAGRDIIGFLFTADAIRLRLERSGPGGAMVPALDEGARAKLSVSPAATRGFLVPKALLAASADLLGDLGPHAASVGLAPRPDAPDSEGRRAIRALLDPLKLPGDAVVMVGARPDERRWAEAARLSRFIAASRYFSAPEAGA
jgi:hypothetical protein